MPLNGLEFAWFATYRLLLQRYNEIEVLHGWEPSNGDDDPTTRNMLVVATNDIIFDKLFPLTIESVVEVRRITGCVL